jgi:ribosomal protein S1
VDDGAAAPLGRGNLVRQVGEIRRKYRWQQLNHDFLDASPCRVSVSARSDGGLWVDFSSPRVQVLRFSRQAGNKSADKKFEED